MTDDLSKGQTAMIDFHMDYGNVAWFAPPGYGKTRGALEVLHQTGDRAIIFAPKLVCANTWPRENAKWDYRLPMRFLSGKNKHFKGNEQISLINPENAKWAVEQLKEHRRAPYKMVFFDELSKWKNAGSVRSKAWMEIRDRFEWSIGMTGTPVGAHLKDLYGEMLVVDGGVALGDDEERFLREHFYEDEYSKGKFDAYHDAEKNILRKLKYAAISFDINDLDMPELVHIAHDVDLPADARDAYNEMHKESAVEDLDLYAINAAVKSSKLRQITGGGAIDIHGGRKKLHSAKAEHLRDILDENDGRPVLVFFEFLSDYITICDVLGYQVPALYGKTTARDGARFIERWNKGRLPVLACHPRSASYGLNLQDAGNVVVWYTVPWSYEMVNQGIARLWRQGQKNKVRAYYLLVTDTEDERVFKRVKEREELHHRVMEGLLR